MISSTSTTLFLIAGAIGVALPVICFFFQKKSDKRMFYLLVGALAYVIVILFVKDTIQYSIVQTNFYYDMVMNFNNGTLLSYLPLLAYQVLMTVGFEVIAFVLAYLFVEKRNPNKMDIFYLGLGYAAMAIIFTLTIPFFQNFQYASMVNDGTINTLIGQNGITQEYVDQLIVYLQQYDILTTILYILDAILRFFVRISAVLFILEGVMKEKKWQHILIVAGYLILTYVIISLASFLTNNQIISMIIEVVIYLPALYYLISSNKKTA